MRCAWRALQLFSALTMIPLMFFRPVASHLKRLCVRTAKYIVMRLCYQIFFSSATAQSLFHCLHSLHFHSLTCIHFHLLLFTFTHFLILTYQYAQINPPRRPWCHRLRLSGSTSSRFRGCRCSYFPSFDGSSSRSHISSRYL